MSTSPTVILKIHSLLESAWERLGQTKGPGLVEQNGEGLWETSIGIYFLEDDETVTIPVDFEVQTPDYPENAPSYLTSIWWLFDVEAANFNFNALDALDSFNSEPGIKLRFEVLDNQPAALVLQAELELALLERSPDVFTTVLDGMLERLFSFVEEHYPTLANELKSSV